MLKNIVVGVLVAAFGLVVGCSSGAGDEQATGEDVGALAVAPPPRPVWPAGMCSSASYVDAAGVICAAPGAACLLPNGVLGSCGSFTNPPNYHNLPNNPPASWPGWDCNVCVPPGQPILPPPPAPPPVVIAKAGGAPNEI